MGTTSNYSWPYPELTAPPNVPSDVRALAIAIDSELAYIAGAQAAEIAALTTEVSALPEQGKISRSAAVTVTNATWTAAVPFDTNDFGATTTMHSTTSNTSRINLDQAGTYRVRFKVRFNAASGGSRRVEIRSGSGGAETGGSLEFNAYEANNTSASVGTDVKDEDYVTSTGSKYLEMFLYQDSGGTINATGGANALWIHVEYLGNFT